MLNVPQWFEDRCRALARETPEPIRCVRLSRLCVRYCNRWHRTGSPVAKGRMFRLMEARDALYLTLDPIQATEYIAIMRGRGVN